MCAITEANVVLKNFWVLWKISGILISLTGIKNKLMLFFLHMFCDFPFVLKIFTTHLTWKIIKFFFYMKTHMWGCTCHMCGREFKMKWQIKNICKKNRDFFLVSRQIYQDSRHLFKNPKVHQSVMGFSNCAQRFTTPYYLDVDSPLPTIIPR